MAEPKETAWDPPAWSNGVPVSGDTITGAGGTAPTGANLVSVANINFSLTENGCTQAEDYVTISGGILAIVLATGSHLTIRSTFSTASMETNAGDVLTVNGDSINDTDEDGCTLAQDGGVVVTNNATLATFITIAAGETGALTIESGRAECGLAITGTLTITVAAGAEFTFAADSSPTGTITWALAAGGMIGVNDTRYFGGSSIPAASTLVVRENAVLTIGSMTLTGIIMAGGDLVIDEAELTLTGGNLITGWGTVDGGHDNTNSLVAAEGIRQGPFAGGIRFQYGHRGDGTTGTGTGV